ncbi:MAG: NAD(P)H-dependent oxidoreductase subunit E, partial [Burkholderiales bacterium]|nr:NAD(P)H-dependent oxidoreductase subunit E [Burkholderiales bacterium]
MATRTSLPTDTRAVSLGRRHRFRGVDPGTKAEVATLIEGLPRQRDQLIEMLHRIQDAKGCLPIASLRALGEILGMAAAEVYE